MIWRMPFGPPPEPWPPMTTESQGAYPELAERFRDLDRELLPRFLRHDGNALRAQRTYRRFQVALIVGAALTSFFGAVQAALGADVRWAAAVVAVLGVATTYTSNQLRREGVLVRYLTERAKAEELRSLYFGYLSGITVDDDRDLEARVADIEHSESHGDAP